MKKDLTLVNWRRISCFLLPFCCLILISKLAHSETLKVSSAHGDYPIGSALYYLADNKYGAITTAEDIANTPLADFKKHQASQFNRVSVDYGYWLRVDISSDAPAGERWLLHSDRVLYNLNVYALVNHQADSLRHIPAQLEGGRSVYAFELVSDETVSLLIHIDGKTAVPLYVQDASGFTNTITIINHLFSAFAGLILGLAIYNFFLYLRLKQASYFFYVFHLITSLYAIIVFEGFLPDLLRSYEGHFNQSYASILFACLFVRSFMSTHKNMPKSDFILVSIACISAGLIFITFEHSHFIMNLLTPALGITAIYIAVHRLSKGFKPARFFLLGWLFPLLSVVLFMFADIGWLVYSAAYKYCYFLGVAVEALLFSLALADRVTLLREEKILLEQKNLELARNENQTKDDFLTAVSHELRTPLNAIFGGLQSAQELPKPASLCPPVEANTGRCKRHDAAHQ
ncbi:MAG: hypothetical protein HRU20_32235 [Pseudomonadales bacterium]|nr:hypothetical protein [Pseudomonadales bacterium]